MTRLLTLPEVADVLRVSVRTVRRLVASGQLQVVKVGRLPRVTEDELSAYLAASYRRVA